MFVAFALALPAGAASLRIASANDPQSFDPHAIALLYQSRVVSQVYESLINRDREFRLEPSLAPPSFLLPSAALRWSFFPSLP